jgi:enoyl-CoA hydratase/carnithine racemase
MRTPLDTKCHLWEKDAQGMLPIPSAPSTGLGLEARDGEENMTEFDGVAEPVVKTDAEGSLLTIQLNRPRVLNSLNLDMIRMIRVSLEKAISEDSCKCVLLCGVGERAFCAGGDIKMLTCSVTEGDFHTAERFFEEEYMLDLFMHQFPKALVVIADGITMGGGLGLAAGADVVIATQRTRMAMPETGIGFFPDVGATGWLFTKCPKGYPEFLGLTGYELKGADTVHCGMASHLFRSEALEGLVEALKTLPESLDAEKEVGRTAVCSLVKDRCEKPIPSSSHRDRWIEKHFSNKSSLREILDSLHGCQSGNPFCQDVLQNLAKRSPTALVLSFELLRLNEGRPLEQVFQVERKAASFMIRHPDYLEGVRAQVIEKGHRPRWNPKTIEEVQDLRKILL